jgi:hypothetical protein
VLSTQVVGLRATGSPSSGRFPAPGRISRQAGVAGRRVPEFVRAVDGFARFDPRRGSDQAWLFGIAAHVFARHCEQSASGRDAVARLAGTQVIAPGTTAGNTGVGTWHMTACYVYPTAGMGARGTGSGNTGPGSAEEAPRAAESQRDQ